MSVILSQEFRLVISLFESSTSQASPHLHAIVQEANRHAVLAVTRHTAREYALLKTAPATTYLAKVLRRDRPRWLENWVDKSTGQAVQVDENDVWICAQARERDLILVTADARIDRIWKADAALRLLII